MTLRRTLRAIVLFVTVTAVTALVTAPAQAAPGDAVAVGSAGSVNVHLDSAPIVVDPIAVCRSDGPAQGSSGTVAVDDFVSYTDGRSTCTVDDAGEIASVEVSGGRFRLDGLRDFGGPRIRLAGFGARCDTTLAGTSSSIQLSGLSGVAVPADLPPNYVTTIANPSVGQPPLATVTFNETIVPSPPDGSMTLNVMHIRLFPEGPGQNTGDVVVGSVHCAPVS